ncbi:MAG TPA: FAD-dependent monooxygenase, partial [Alphaproteobacteria bacterium]|nr:FAD-dependent monooxygenase [Alphaproteobacteria bacterium]
PDTKTITLNGKEKVQADVVIGADGAFSALRKTMLDKVMNFDYSQSFLDAGYKELVIPPGPGGEFLIEKEALHIWPRGAYMMIALPNTDGNFTCTLFFGRDGFDALKTPTDIKTFFEKNFPDALALMPTLIEDFTNNPTGSLVTVKCNPWHIGGQALLIGDAAHAIVPFFGQGMNCGFEDCFVLDELVSGPGADWESVFAKFNMLRKPNADAIADMAAENFIEMRDTTADPKFQLKKKIGFELEKRYPQRFIPRY